MTVSTTVNRIDYTAPLAGVALAVPFPCFDATHLKLTKDADGTVLTLATHYTVALNTATFQDCTVTPTTAGAALIGAGKLIIRRVVPMLQPLAIPAANRLPEKEIEKAFDLAAMRSQQLTQRADEVDASVASALAKFATIDANVALTQDAANTSVLGAGAAAAYAQQAQAAAATFDATSYLVRANNLADVPNKPQARSNMGIGSAGTKDVGTAAGQVPVLDGTGKLDAGVLPSAGGALPKGALFPRSILSYTSGTVASIAPGVARSDDDTTDLKWTGALTLTNTTTGANGMDVAVTNGQTVHVFVIYNPTTTAYAAFGSSSLAPTLPSGYTKKRRVGSLRCTAAATTWPQFYNVGDEFFWNAPQTESASFGLVANTPININLAYLPQGLVLKVRNKITGGSGSMWFDNPTQPQVFPNGGLQTMSTYTGLEHLYSNTSAQVRFVSQTGVTIAFSTEGWWDTREA